jgi:hypothetical protein
LAVATGIFGQKLRDVIDDGVGALALIADQPTSLQTDRGTILAAWTSEEIEQEGIDQSAATSW